MSDPFNNPEDTDWGQKVNQSLHELQGIRNEFRALHGELRRLHGLMTADLLDHDAIKREIAEIDALVKREIKAIGSKIDELKPVLTGIRITRNTGKWALRLADFTQAAGKVALTAIGTIVLVVAVVRGDKLIDAVEAFLRTIGKL